MLFALLRFIESTVLSMIVAPFEETVNLSETVLFLNTTFVPLIVTVLAVLPVATALFLKVNEPSMELFSYTESVNDPVIPHPPTKVLLAIVRLVQELPNPDVIPVPV